MKHDGFLFNAALGLALAFALASAPAAQAADFAAQAAIAAAEPEWGAANYGFAYQNKGNIGLDYGNGTGSLGLPQDNAVQIRQLWNLVTKTRNEDKPQTEAGYLREILKLAGESGDCSNLLKAMDGLKDCIRKYEWKEERTLFGEFEKYSAVFAKPKDKTAYLAFMVRNYDQMTDYDYRGDSQEKYFSAVLDTVVGFRKELMAEPAGEADFYVFGNEEKTSFPCFCYYEVAMRYFYERFGSYDYSGLSSENAKRCLDEMLSVSEGHPSSEIYAQCLINAGRSDDVSLGVYEGLLKEYPSEKASVWPEAERIRIYYDRACAAKPQKEADFLKVKEMCEKAVAKYGKSSYRERIENIRKSMEEKSMSFNVGKDGEPSGFFYPGDEVPCSIGFKNIDEVRMTLYKIADYAEPLLDFADKGQSEAYLKTKAKAVRTETLSGLKAGYGVTGTKECGFKVGEPGNYVLAARPFAAGNAGSGKAALQALDGGRQTECLQFRVSAIATAFRQRGNIPEIYSADYRTGEPLKSGNVVFFKDNNSSDRLQNGYKAYDRAEKKQFDGFTSIKDAASKSVSGNRRDRFIFNVESGSDMNSPMTDYWPQGSFRETVERAADGGDIYVDRMLYKPKETVKFAVVAYSAGFTEGKVRAGLKVNAELFGPGQDKPLADLDLLTDDLGMASGEFALPEGSMNGIWRIVCDNNVGNVWFRVENYVHPNFSVEMEKQEGITDFGDDVFQNGEVKSYSGFSVSNAEVTYEVWMSPLTRRSFYTRFDRFMIASGVVKSDADGKFSIQFNAREPEAKDDEEESERKYARYEIMATVKDPQGETHSAEADINVGSVPLDLSDSFKDSRTFGEYEVVNKDAEAPLTIFAKNLDGVSYDISGQYSFTSKGAAEPALKGGFKQGEPVGTQYAALASGCYKLDYSVQCNGKRISDSTSLILLSASDTKCPVDTELFFCPLVTENGIEYLVGTTEPDLWVECGLFDNDKPLRRDPLHLQDQMMKVALPYADSYPNAVSLTLAAFRNRKFFSQEQNFTRLIDRRLNVEVESFRDMTVPDSDEQFFLHITDHRTGAAPISESTVSIFDVTTDRMGANSFGFNPFTTYYSGAPSISTNLGDRFNRPHYIIGYGSSRMFKTRGMVTMAAAAPMEGVLSGAQSNDAYALEEPMMDSVNSESASVESPDEGTGASDDVEALRSDFGETVAFYPQLRSDADGRVTVKYHTTDGLSTFRVLVHSHTADLLSGSADTSFVVRKQLMIQPNLPMFVREGDRIVLKAKVINLTSKALKGNAKLVLYDGADGSAKAKGGEYKLEVALNPNEQKEVSWEVSAPEKQPLLGIRMSVAAGGYTDGMQQVIPVIPSRTQVTESVSAIMDQRKTYTLDLKRLMKKVSAKDEKVTVDVSSPLTSVLEALPTVGEPSFDCMTDWLAALFINQTGEYMFSTYPEMADKVRQLVNGGWKKSQISVNSEITGVLLNETPWAYKESEDNRRIDRMKNYLDPNYTVAFRVKAMNKIAALQGSDGGFAWFSGVPSSEWLTMLFLDKMYELEQIGALNPNQKEDEMMKEACKFLDNSLRKQYEDYLRECRKMKKEPDKSFIHWGTLELMAVRSEFPGTTVAASSREAYDFYFDCVFNHWKNTNIADKANIIKLLANTADPVGAVADPSAGVSLRAKSIVDDSKYGCAEEVKKVIASLDDYAVKNSSIGCYFPNASMPFRGMMNNELYAHAQLLRMYDRLTDKYLGSALPAEKGLGYDMREIVRGLGLWLMLQKHNQCWENDVATTDAIYALLSSGVCGLSDAATPAFEILSPSGIKAAEPVPGALFRYEVPVSELKAAGSIVKIKKEYDGLLSAAAYYRYTQPEQLAKASSNGISVERKFYRRKVYENSLGKTPNRNDVELTEIPIDSSLVINDGERMKVGEVITAVYRIKNDENRSFVHLRSLRPACFYPVDEASGYTWQWGCYLENRESMTNFFFYVLPEGTTEIREQFYVTQEGIFSTSLVSVQSLYAPEYRGQDKALNIISR